MPAPVTSMQAFGWAMEWLSRFGCDLTQAQKDTLETSCKNVFTGAYQNLSAETGQGLSAFALIRDHFAAISGAVTRTNGTAASHFRA